VVLGGYNHPGCDEEISMANRDEWLREIAGWKLEAADEDNSRYFYGLPGVSSVQSGDKCYVIGRKGSGKTAVAEHIRGLSGPRTFVRSLSFKNFPFNDLYKLEDKSFTNPSQYTTIWKHIIYSAICHMMSQNAAIDASISGELAKHFSIDVERALARSISKIGDRSGGFTLFGSGGNVGLKSVIVENNSSWQERTDILEQLILTYVDDAKYFIIFDELDEDYRDVVGDSVARKYLDLLIGLFKATQDVRRKMRRGTNVLPLVFLRSDIYELLRDNDKNKWRDSALTLSWSESNLRDLTAFRLSRAQAANGRALTFDDVIDQLFTAETTRAGGARRQRHVFAYILAYTLWRPRDIISYLRECANFALENGSKRISPNRFSEVNRAYSLRLRQEFVDEMQGAVPFIDGVFEIMSRMRKQIFSFAEFKMQFNLSVEAREIDATLDFETVCRVLFHYSAIGNQPSQNTAKIYQYVYPNARINFTENAVIHRGLLQSLQIN
jgi:energy-coupling factor transporter ATP-binding protein EcfA2